jgi:uncharacterized membrane protein
MAILLRPSTPRLLALGLWVIIGAHVATLWSDLPPLMASHFGASGLPNGWMSRDSFFMTMGVVGGGTTALLMLLPLLFRALPTELINLPNKEYWLSRERRGETLDRLAAFMAWFGFATAALLALVLELAVAANLAQTPLDNATFIVGMALYVAALLVLVVATFRAFRMPPTATR